MLINYHKKTDEKGMSLIGLLLAVSVIIIAMVALSMVLPVAMKSVLRSESSAQALNYAREKAEFVASRADDYFTQMQPVSKTAYPDDPDYQYSIAIDNVTEDGNGNIISAGYDTTGIQTNSGLKKATVTLYWDEQGTEKSVSVVTYFSGKSLQTEHLNSGVITGMITNLQDSSGIGGATVTAVSTSLDPVETLTGTTSSDVGSEGTYTIEGVVPDTYTISCAANGFYEGSSVSQNVAAGGNYVINFQLYPDYNPFQIKALPPSSVEAGPSSAMVVTIQVQNAGGDRMWEDTDAMIEITGQVGGSNANSVTFTATTMTGASGLNTSTISGTIPSGEATVTITDTESEQITIHPTSSGLESIDATGIFTDPSVGSAYKIVLLSASTVVAGTPLTVNFQVQDANDNLVSGTYDVTVRILSESNPNASALITASTMSSHSQPPSAVLVAGTSDGDDTVTITNDEAETLTIQAGCASLTVNEVTATYTFTSNSGTISGTVTDDNDDAVGSALITIHDESNSIPDYTVSTDSYGAYTQSVENGRTYTVSVSKSQYESKSTSGVSIPGVGSSATVNFSIMHYGTITGTVTDNNTSDPLYYAEVTVTVDVSSTFTVYTDSGGAYSVDVPAGNHPVQTTKTGYQSSTITTVPVVAGATNTGVDFALDQNPAFVTGFVTYYHNAQNPDKKAAGANIIICDDQGNESALTAISSTSNGSYTITGIPAGDHTVKFKYGSYPDFLTSVMTFVAGSTYEVSHNFQ